MDWARFNPPVEIADVLAHCPKVIVASTVGELAKLACGDDRADASFEVAYDLPGRSRLSEAIVARVRNGIVVNYTEPYMRRRDPDCMVIGDDQPTDKETFARGSVSPLHRCARKPLPGSRRRSCWFSDSMPDRRIWA